MRDRKYMIQVNTLVSAEQWAKLEQTEEATQRTKSEIIRELIDSLVIEKSEKKKASK